MKIREMSVKNLLSFSDKGLNKDDCIRLGDFNLFIGPNNSGKSNILKLVQMLRVILDSVQERDSEPIIRVPLRLGQNASNFTDWFFAQDPNRTIEFSFSLEIEESDKALVQMIESYNPREKQNPVNFMFHLTKGYPKAMKIQGTIAYLEDYPGLTINRVEIPNQHQVYSKKPILFDRETRSLLELRPEMANSKRLVFRVMHYQDEAQWKQHYASTGQAFTEFIVRLRDRVVQTLFVSIPAIRTIEAGGNTIDALLKLGAGRQSSQIMLERVQGFLKELIFGSQAQMLKLVFPEDPSGKGRCVELAVEKLQLPLNHYGSCVEQMLALSTQIMCPDPNRVVLIEEPEAHLHPDLQRKLLRFLWKNRDILKHQYLVATHSNVFIDEFLNMGGNVFHCRLDQNEAIAQQYSVIDLIGRDDLLKLFIDLGVKPSDLLLANAVLVVEGMIDKDVYTDWARKIGRSFEEAAIEVVDAKGCGNIRKYLESMVVQRTTFKTYGLCDKNAEATLRSAVEGIVFDHDIIVLDKGDIEDYYPRKLVQEFAMDFGRRKGKESEIPDRINEGETVTALSKLLGGDWWKTNLADIVIEKMKPADIQDEIKDKLTRIYETLYIEKMPG